MHVSSVRLILLLSVLLLSCTLLVSAEPAPNFSDLGVVIPASSYGGEDLTGEISVIDILPLLNTSGFENVSMPASVAIVKVESGQIFSPNAIRPSAEVLYILSGSTQVSADDAMVKASEGDAILVPAGSVMMVNNTGADSLTFFSILSTEDGRNITGQTLMKRSPESKQPVLFGNATDSDSFTVNRMYSTFEETLPLSFDLAVATIPAGNSVSDHYMESGQLGYVLSGTGSTTIGCESHRIAEGDITYVPPYAVQRFDASNDLKILLLTEPFYQPDKDYPSPGLC
ncbi:MAG: cupin domain-containing protein [Methanobacteriota archaeon]